MVVGVEHVIQVFNADGGPQMAKVYFVNKFTDFLNVWNQCQRISDADRCPFE